MVPPPASRWHRRRDRTRVGGGGDGHGIVSIALSLDGQETISRVVLVLAAVFWVALGVLLPARATRDRKRFLTRCP